MNAENNRIMEFDAVILQNEGMDAAYVEVPFDIMLTIPPCLAFILFATCHLVFAIVNYLSFLLNFNY